LYHCAVDDDAVVMTSNFLGPTLSIGRDAAAGYLSLRNLF